MTYEPYKPVLILCRRAARLWRRRMTTPEYDQLGHRRANASPQERRNEAMASALVSSICKDTTPEQLALFEEHLVAILMTEYPFADYAAAQSAKLNAQIQRIAEGNKPLKEKGLPIHAETCKQVLESMKYLARRDYETNLRVDYDPCWALSIACERAGLPTQQVPIKSDTTLGWDGDLVTSSFGYGAPRLYHYPMDEEGRRWLVTSLSGQPEDIAHLKTLANAYPDEFQIDEEEGGCNAPPMLPQED